MTTNYHRGIAAAVFACVSFAPAVAQRTPVHAHVSIAGLDLTTPRDRAIFDARLRTAAANTCTSLAHGPVKIADENRCRDEMMRDGATQVAALTDHRTIELASTGR